MGLESHKSDGAERSALWAIAKSDQNSIAPTHKQPYKPIQNALCRRVERFNS